MALHLVSSYGNGQFVISTSHALAFCLSKELNYIQDHISSMRAGLKTWLDHLERIQELERNFDSLFESLASTLDKIDEFLKKSESEITAEAIMVRHEYFNIL